MASTRHIQRTRRLGFWAGLALLIHAEVLILAGVILYFKAPRDADLKAAAGAVGETIELNSLDDEALTKLLAEIDREEEKQKEEQAKKEQESKDSPGQVVDLAKPEEEKRPDKARFAADYDVTVEKETKKYGRFDQDSRQGSTEGNADVTRPEAQPSQAQKGALAMRSPSKTRSPNQSPSPAQPAVAPSPQGVNGTNAPEDPEGVLTPGARGQARAEAQAATPPPGGSPSAAPPSPFVSPSQQQIARAIGGGTEDHLKDIDDGDETSLNAKKWKFASFFNRIKAQVREHWRPADVYRRRDPTGSIYGSKDRYTLLRVQLKPDGSLANVALETPSGVEFLDDEAIEAFKEAQPFPNPPSQLVDAGSGMIDFKFGFYFEIGGATRFKAFRYNSM
jgi:TonB family protein